MSTKEELKNEGMELLEDVTVDAILHVFNFAKNMISKNATLKALAPVLETIENYLLKKADSIDGKIG